MYCNGIGTGLGAGPLSLLARNSTRDTALKKQPRRSSCCVGFATLMILAGCIFAVPVRAQTLAVDPDSAAVATAYLDEGARELVRLARARRRTSDRSIEAYETSVRERISLNLRLVDRTRTLWQQELAVRVDWTRDGPVLIDVLGAREFGDPDEPPGLRVPDDLHNEVPRLAFEPGDPHLFTGWGNEHGDVRHPFEPGSEVDYRFRSGDTTTIRLPEGGEIRLVELLVLPRRREWDLVQGSFWLDSDSHAVVQATFRPAGDLERKGEELPLALRHIFAPSRTRVEHVTIEYGLWDSRWWLPRTFAVRGAATVGRVGTVPFVFERTYSDYQVRGNPGGDTLPAGELRSVRCAAHRRRSVLQAGIVLARPGASRRDAPPATDLEHAAAGREQLESERRACARVRVVIPPDSASLLASDALPPSPYAGGSLQTDSELNAIHERLAALPRQPWEWVGVRVRGPTSTPGLLRYNRIEGLSAGVRAETELGPVDAAATIRLGLADLEPKGEVAVDRAAAGSRVRGRVYRDLLSMDSEATAFDLISSFSSLVLGRDEVDFYRAAGADFTRDPSPSRPASYQWRIYAQRESAVSKNTDFSVPRLFDSTRTLSENDSAQAATQFGFALQLRTTPPADPTALTAGAEFSLGAAAGTFNYAQPMLLLRAGFPLPGPLVGHLEGAAGTSIGDVAHQHLWRIGGTQTVRGYPAGLIVGRSFWRGRVAAGTELPMARFVVFSDAGWAGTSQERGGNRVLLSVGAGGSLFDGMLRLDLARALVSPIGWRLTLYVDGRL